MTTIKNATIIEIGEPKYSTSWTNIYVRFKEEDGKELWLYYSEHVEKPTRLKQIDNLVVGNIKVGDQIDVKYKIAQSQNRSTKLSIIEMVNHRPKI